MAPLELDLSPNGNQIKLRWRVNGPFSKPIILPAPLIRDRASRIRLALNGLDKYVEKNPLLSVSRDPEYIEYDAIMRRLCEAGRSLEHALFRPESPEATALRAELLKSSTTQLKIFCSDGEVTLPFGFIYNSTTISTPRIGPPSFTDFSGFWTSRYRVTVYIEGGGCDSDGVIADADHFGALYALHQLELGKAAHSLGQNTRELQKLFQIKANDHYNWNSAAAAWSTISELSNIVFVFAHSDGDWLRLGDVDSDIDCLMFADLLTKPNPSTPTLLILNCCLSASGSEGASLLSVVARRGFCGLVGTKSTIQNHIALSCGTHLMWELCANGKTLGDAFDSMQMRHDLFPLNLLYTCCADRAFRLTRPISVLADK